MLRSQSANIQSKPLSYKEGGARDKSPRRLKRTLQLTLFNRIGEGRIKSLGWTRTIYSKQRMQRRKGKRPNPTSMGGSTPKKDNFAMMGAAGGAPQKGGAEEAGGALVTRAGGNGGSSRGVGRNPNDMGKPKRNHPHTHTRADPPGPR